MGLSSSATSRARFAASPKRASRKRSRMRIPSGRDAAPASGNPAPLQATPLLFLLFFLYNPRRLSVVKAMVTLSECLQCALVLRKYEYSIAILWQRFVVEKFEILRETLPFHTYDNV